MKKLLILESKNLEYSALRKPEMTEDEQQQLDRAILEIRSKYRNLTIYDNIRTLSESMREISRHKPDVIFDDYGNVFIATDEGISILETSFAKNISSKNISVSPNPFIIGKDSQIIISNVARNSTIKIMNL